ncbi:heterokaryon incompatibility protein [Rutstroemia sp. NJR-2017a BVV2]|nr:heterokaryon incompatibility protein [Rutstroemia sp. NJR-2017a BVV2]PQE21710.1 heterokaryon incompatibility protein [Rutstroemia sp. NJR-2017a BVV2]
MIPQDIIPADDREASNAERSPSTAFARAAENGLPREKSQPAETERQNEIEATSSDFQAFAKAVVINKMSYTAVSAEGSVVSPLSQWDDSDEEQQIGSDGYDTEGISKCLEKDTIWWPSEVGIDTNELRRTARKQVDTWRSIDTLPSINPDHCPFCRVYFDSWDSVIRKSLSMGNGALLKLATPFHEDIDQLKLSAFRGCPLCKYITSILRICGRKNELPGHIKNKFKFEGGTYLALWPGHMKHKNYLVGEVCYLCLENSRHSMFLVKLKPYNPSLSAFTTAEYDSDKFHNLPVAEQSCHAPPEQQTGALNLARRWLNDCFLNHEGCSQQDRTIIPTRLIKIELKKIRLCYSSQYEDCSKYATLSHCWGELEVFKLRKSNHLLLLQEIPYAGLCKTFRDAVEIARSLGFSWLWIDSLCIIQDDPDDWRKESARMTTVYGMSTLNIAATAAADGRTGCLFERDDIYTQGSRAVIEVDDKQQILDIVDTGLVYDNTTETPLSKRAWALQERLLAPRTLYFGVSQLFWHCATRRACDRYSNQLPQWLQERDSISKVELHKEWNTIVRMYTASKLRYQSDRVVAIAGIARVIGNKTGDEYLAGLWRKDFEMQLCWRAKTPLTYVEPRLPGVPSWSWLGIPGETFYMNSSTSTLFKSSIKVISVVITFEGSPTCDPFNCIDGGALAISTRRILPCIVRLHHFWDPDSKYDSPCGEIFVAGRAVDARLFMDYYQLEDFDEVCVLVSIGTSHIPIQYYTDTKMAWHDGIFLKRTPKNGQYVRVGVFRIQYDTAKSREEDLFERADAIENMPTESDYESVTVANGETWYTITIV